MFQVRKEEDLFLTTRGGEINLPMAVFHVAISVLISHDAAPTLGCPVSWDESYSSGMSGNKLHYLLFTVRKIGFTIIEMYFVDNFLLHVIEDFPLTKI